MVACRRWIGGKGRWVPAILWLLLDLLSYSKKMKKVNNSLLPTLVREILLASCFSPWTCSFSNFETRGLCILWRMNHDQLLEFIASHGSIAGQLCLNLAGLLADRLLKENTVVSKVKMDLEDAISSLRVASEEDNLKTLLLKNLWAKLIV